MKSRIRLAQLFFLSSATLLFFLILGFSVFWGVEQYRNLRAENLRIRTEQLESRKRFIHQQLLRTISFLEFKNSQTQLRLKGELRERVNVAHAVAARIYASYGNRLTEPELAALVIGTLRSMHFNNGRSRFFIMDFTGINRMNDEDNALEGKNLINLSDRSGRFVYRDMIRIAREKGEGFYSYTGTKNGVTLPRIAFFRRFDPLNWLIGTGEYPSLVEYEIKQEALAQLGSIRYSDNGYIFVIRSDGVMLSDPDNRLVGKNLLQDPDSLIRDTAARLIRAGQRPEGGEIRHMWPRPTGGAAIAKLSYTKTFAPWGWIVGTGVYLDDIDKEIAAAEARYRETISNEIISGILLLVSFIAFSMIVYRFIASRMDKELESLTGFFKRAASSHEKIDTGKLKFQEFANIGASANLLVGDFLETQERLQEIERIIESTPAVAFGWKNEPGWPVHVVSKNVADVFGYTADDFLSGRIRYSDVIHPEDRERVAGEVETYGREMDAFSHEYRIIAGDGSTKWLDHRTFTVRDRQGHIMNYQGVVVDISDLKQLELKHSALERQYQQAQKMEAVGRLSGGVAHDFNNLLTVILGYTEILLKKATGEDSLDREGLKQIHEAALKAKEMTSHLLVFSRNQPMEMVVMDVNEIVTVSGKMLTRMIGEDIELRLSTASGGLNIKGDVTQIDQVLMNLAINARDAMPAGGILTIETAGVELDETYASGKADLAAGMYAMIAVSDTGTGIDEAIKSHIFEPFFTTKEMEKGTGLGLATCYGIIRQHNGHIFCYSEIGRGTTFKIYLPLVQDEVTEKTEPAPTEMVAQALPATILVIEDDPAVLKYTRSILSTAGYHVLEATHPKDAIAVAGRLDDPIHLVVSDIILPDMKGPEIYAEIRKLHPEVGVIYMSGYTQSSISAHGLVMDNTNYIQKPFPANLLLEQVAAVLNNR